MRVHVVVDATEAMFCYELATSPHSFADARDPSLLAERRVFSSSFPA